SHPGPGRRRLEPRPGVALRAGARCVHEPLWPPPGGMACQGCGRVSETRLCCPTCVELGRTSFFCGQECFTKNWKTHAALHDLLRKQRALAEGGGGVSSAAPSAPSGPAPEQPARREFEPLPGGVALRDDLAPPRPRAGAAAPSRPRPQVRAR
ncbi:unnamed protein product, partial [Prorocentrum cordatum]